jgi:hypothetical protein
MDSQRQAAGDDEAFIVPMRTYGVPSEVLFERVCREHGITAKLTGPYSPTTGKAKR